MENPSKYRATYLHNGMQHVAVVMAESEADASTKIAQNALSVHGQGLIDIISCDLAYRDDWILLPGEVHIYY